MAFQRANSTFLRRTPFAHTMSARRPETLSPITSARTAANASIDRLARAVALHNAAAIAEMNAANKIELGPPIQLRSGTITRQAKAPPIRSAPYMLGMREDSWAKIVEKRKMLKEDHRKQSCEGKLKQQRRKTAQGDAGQQSSLAEHAFGLH